MDALSKQRTASIEQLLRGAETEFCRLRAQREAIEMSLDETPLKDSFQVGRLRSELRSLSEQIALTQIELFEHRIALLQEQLPEDKEAIAPLQRVFEQAQERYVEAVRERQVAAVALHIAQTQVGSAESNISFYERSIAGLKQELARASKGSPEKSASEIASELSSLEKRLGQLRTMSSQSVIG